MFTQVYFHKTRVAYDVHLRGALEELLPNSRFPSPSNEHLKEFLGWDDWRVLGLLASGNGGEHGARLASREHFRLAYSEEESSQSWYKTGKPDIQVVSNVDPDNVLPLAKYSHVVLNMKPSNQSLLYVRPEQATNAYYIVRRVLRNERDKQGSFGFDSSSG